MNSGGVFDMSALTTAGMTAGSIEGAGDFFLGEKELTTGLNNLSTEVSGVIADGGTAGGSGGSIIKVGTGTLTLLGTNTYSGGTTFIGGIVAVERDANLGRVFTVRSTPYKRRTYRRPAGKSSPTY